MSNEELIKKILSMFKEDMSAEKRLLLIKLYNACVLNKDKVNEPSSNLLQIEKAANMISDKIERNYVIQKPIYVDSEKIQDIKKRHFSVSLEDLKKITENNKKINNNFKEEILKNYIMLEDCINNYDEENTLNKKITIELLTKLEILLQLPVTYPSQISNCVDDIINEEEKGGVSFGK